MRHKTDSFNNITRTEMRSESLLQYGSFFGDYFKLQAYLQFTVSVKITPTINDKVVLAHPIADLVSFLCFLMYL